MQLTKAQKAALTRWNAGQFSPRYGNVRTDVAYKLYERELVTSYERGDTFRAGYSVLKITDRGRRVLAQNAARSRRSAKAEPLGGEMGE